SASFPPGTPAPSSARPGAPSSWASLPRPRTSRRPDARSCGARACSCWWRTRWGARARGSVRIPIAPRSWPPTARTSACARGPSPSWRPRSATASPSCSPSSAPARRNPPDRSHTTCGDRRGPLLCSPAMSHAYLFFSESVTEGHPDKLADRISDAVLDAILAVDPGCRVACETLVTTGLVMVAGEISTSEDIEIPAGVRRAVTEIGYTDANFGIDGDTWGVVTSIQEQSPDIARGVDEALEHREGRSIDELDALGAGDQGMMFGYACRETDEVR